MPTADESEAELSVEGAVEANRMEGQSKGWHVSMVG